MISLPMGVLPRVLELSPPPAGAPSPFDLGEVGALERAFTEAGFTDVESEPVAVTMDWPSSEEYIAFLRDIAPVNSILAPHPAEKQAQAWQAIREAAQRYATADGAIRMPNEAICVVGRR